MATLNLPERQLERLRALLETYAPDAEVWAYGSRVSGQAHEASDLDLVLRDPDDPARPQQRLWELKEALSESNIPILVDVLDWARLPAAFHDEIDRSHVVIRRGKHTSHTAE